MVLSWAAGWNNYSYLLDKDSYARPTFFVCLDSPAPPGGAEYYLVLREASGTQGFDEEEVVSGDGGFVFGFSTLGTALYSVELPLHRGAARFISEPEMSTFLGGASKEEVHPRFDESFWQKEKLKRGYMRGAKRPIQCLLSTSAISITWSEEGLKWHAIAPSILLALNENNEMSGIAVIDLAGEIAEEINYICKNY